MDAQVELNCDQMYTQWTKFGRILKMNSWRNLHKTLDKIVIKHLIPFV